jgi:site-specific DNA recombinase
MRPISPRTSRPLACVIHCRVSTPKQAYEGESLDVQANTCERIASERGWHLAHQPWKESFSGRKSQRPVFDEVLEFIDQNPGAVRYYLFRSIDRFTRAGIVVYEEMKHELTKRGVEMVDSYGIIQPSMNSLAHLGFEYEWSRIRPSEISELVSAVNAKQEASTILTRIIGQEISLTQRGFKIGSPRDGFQNAKKVIEGRKYPIELPDPVRAKYIVAIYELRASGQYSDQEICDQVNAMGYRTPVRARWNAGRTEIIGQSGGLSLTPKAMQDKIPRPIYCGFIRGKWTGYKLVKAQYAGLVSIDTFNRANRGKVYVHSTTKGSYEFLHNYQPDRIVRRRSTANPEFPLKNVLRCALCGKHVLGSSPRGQGGKRFAFYHCARKHPYWGVKKGDLEAAMDAVLTDIHFVPATMGLLRAHLIQLRKEYQAELLDAAASIGNVVGELEIKKAQTVRAFKAATTDLMRNELEAEAGDLQRQIDSACNARNVLELTEADIDAYIADLRKVIEHPAILLKNPANIEEHRALYRLLFAEFPTVPEILNRTPKLTAICNLFLGSKTPKSVLVHLRRIRWNQIEQIIFEWRANKPYLVRFHQSVPDDLAA